MLLCTVFQGRLVQKIYVHSLNQDERAQISAGQRNIKDIKDLKKLYNKQDARVQPIYGLILAYSR